MAGVWTFEWSVTIIRSNRAKRWHLRCSWCLAGMYLDQFYKGFAPIAMTKRDPKYVTTVTMKSCNPKCIWSINVALQMLNWTPCKEHSNHPWYQLFWSATVKDGENILIQTWYYFSHFLQYITSQPFADHGLHWRYILGIQWKRTGKSVTMKNKMFQTHR